MLSLLLVNSKGWRLKCSKKIQMRKEKCPLPFFDVFYMLLFIFLHLHLQPFSLPHEVSILPLPILSR